TFKEDLFASAIKHGIIQDSSEPSNDNSNVVNAPREPFVVNQDPDKNSSQSPPHINHHCCYECGDPLEGIFYRQYTCKLCGNGAHYGYNCAPKVLILSNPEPFHNQTIKELPPTMQSFDLKPDLVHKSPNVSNPPSQLIQKKEEEKKIEEAQAANARYWKITACYDDDDDYNFAITPNKPDYSLSMGDEHLDTIPAMESDEFIKSSVENLVPIPSESEGESECDVPTREEFTTLSNVLFDAEYDFDSSDDQSFSDKDVPEKLFSNPLFEEEIIPMKIDQHHDNVESDLIESPRIHDSSLIISSKIDSLFDEFADELTLLKSIPSGIDETDCDPEEDIHLIEKLLYDNSSPRLPEEFVSVNSDTEIESFSPSPIPVKDSDSLMEEIDLYFTLDYLMPPGIEDDDYDSEWDILILEDLPSNDTLSIPEKSPSILIFLRSLVLLQNHQMEKSPDLLSHRGLKTFQPTTKCPMMIHGKNIPILDVHLFHFYPL
nr:hypothetical protein [Tanacetum cinerariifolium]